jgi:hypothetical protein
MSVFICRLRRRGKQDDLDLQRPRSHGTLESFHPFLDGIFGIEQGLDIDKPPF